MVASGQNIRASIIEFLADFGRNAKAMGCVFDIHHRDINRQTIAEHRQCFQGSYTTALTQNIAEME